MFSDEENRMREFMLYVTALPREMEGSLISDTVSTAYFQARDSGHQHDYLVDDALFAVRGGAGIGALVLRLRSLAKHPPTTRPTRPVTTPQQTITKMPQRHQFLSGDGVFCDVCQLPAHNRAHAGFPLVPPPAPEEVTPPEWVEERAHLLQMIYAKKLSPDEAEYAMRSLIAAQKSR